MVGECVSEFRSFNKRLKTLRDLEIGFNEEPFCLACPLVSSLKVLRCTSFLLLFLF